MKGHLFALFIAIGGLAMTNSQATALQIYNDYATWARAAGGSVGAAVVTGTTVTSEKIFSSTRGMFVDEGPSTNPPRFDSSIPGRSLWGAIPDLSFCGCTFYTLARVVLDLVAPTDAVGLFGDDGDNDNGVSLNGTILPGHFDLVPPTFEGFVGFTGIGETTQLIFSGCAICDNITSLQISSILVTTIDEPTPSYPLP